jgi:twitching motility protein PilT
MAAIESLFHTLKAQGGSDLHLSTGLPPAYRASGHIEAFSGRVALEDSELRGLLKDIVTSTQWEVFCREHDLDFAYALEGVGRFRGNYYEQERGVGAVFRMIPETVLSAKKLDLPEAVCQLANLESGLVLVTGPTGSGKSTTLAGIIDLINETHCRHIVTIEDPLEFVHQNKKSIVSHREIGTHTPNFASALRAALREDADVVLVGEMRDFETISLALEGASMGALVFGTLHTNGAAKTIDRIVDAFPRDQAEQARGMLSESLQAVVSQVLCRKVTGGRRAILEILLRETGLGGAIREGSPGMLNSIIGAGKGRGMQLLDDGLDAALKAGDISGTEAYMKANDKKRFAQFANTGLGG